MPASSSSQHADLSTILATRKYADLIIKSNAKEHLVHRAVMAPQCRVLGDLVVKKTSKEPMQKLELLDIDSEVMDQIINFCYTGTYRTDAWNENAKDALAIDAGLTIYKGARQLDVPRLQEVVLRTLSKLLSYDWTAPVRGSNNGWSSCRPVVARQKAEVVLSFIREALKLMADGDDALKALITDTGHFYAVELCKSVEFDSIIDKNHNLAVQMLRKSSRVQRAPSVWSNWDVGPSAGSCQREQESDGEIVTTCMVGQCQNSNHYFGSEVIVSEDGEGVPW